jgi:hypothetical protein
MGQFFSLYHISKFIQSSEAEYHLSFDTECQGGFMQIHLQFYTSETIVLLQSGKFIFLVSWPSSAKMNVIFISIFRICC